MKRYLSTILLTLAAVVSCIFVGCDIETYLADGSSQTDVSTGAYNETSAYSADETNTAAETSSADDPYVEYHFRTENQLMQHFQKHGSEFDESFGYETAADYEKGASDVINDSDSLFKYEAEDGDGVYYLEGTNEFVRRLYPYIFSSDRRQKLLRQAMTRSTAYMQIYGKFC